jgi:hypothetical protein
MVIVFFSMKGKLMSTARTATAAFLVSFGFSAPTFAADALEAPQSVSPYLSGYVEGYLGGVHLSQGNNAETEFGYGVAGRANVPFNDRWNAQVDLTGEWVKVKAEDATIGMYSATLHGFWRDPGSFAVGGFGNWQGGSVNGEMSNLYAIMVGPEAQVYFDKVTLYGQAYFGQMRSTESSNHSNTWGLRGVARYFVQPNMRLSAEAAFMTVDVGAQFNTVSVAAQADYRFNNSPVSLFGRYQFDHMYLAGTSNSFDTHKFSAGLRLSFGSGTLLDEDRSGATMDTYRPNLSMFPGAG